MQPGDSPAHLGLQPQLVVEEAAEASVDDHSSKPVNIVVDGGDDGDDVVCVRALATQTCVQVKLVLWWD